MFIPFNDIPATSRVWIYQSDRLIFENEEVEILQIMEKFIEQWTAHGKDLQASVSIRHGYFLILALNESAAGATGCSIDASVHALKEIGSRFGINFFDRDKIAINSGLQVYLMPRQELIEGLKDGEIPQNTLTYNNLVSTKLEMENNWKVEIQNSWLKRYLRSTQNVDKLTD